jgi:hypothetical protein
MKAYLVVTAIVFGAIAIAHALRVMTEGMQAASDPFFLFLTALAVALCVWAFSLLWHLRRRQPTA